MRRRSPWFIFRLWRCRTFHRRRWTTYINRKTYSGWICWGCNLVHSRWGPLQYDKKGLPKP